MASAAVFGTALEIIRSMTDNLTITDGATNLVTGTTGLGGSKTLTLPPISAMVASQNLMLFVVNTVTGNTFTVAAASGDSIVGIVSITVGTAVTYRHDGRHTWYAT